MTDETPIRIRRNDVKTSLDMLTIVEWLSPIPQFDDVILGSSYMNIVFPLSCTRALVVACAHCEYFALPKRNR